MSLVAYTDGGFAAVTHCLLPKESELAGEGRYVNKLASAVWSFYRFLHLTTSEARRNPWSERSELVDAISQLLLNI